MFRLSSSIRAASSTRPTVLLQQQTRKQSTSVFAWNNLKKFVPQVPLSFEATLGQVWDGLYTNYRYKMVYPILLWIAFLQHNLWVPYTKESDKAVLRAKEERLQKLEYHQL
ncbi:hypothetical protein SeLEV6574_g04536 [Synchytrium endobioticum]|uniref:Uncharacterized protein n=1 Tax=Synchytrium endobioticum TaxID=286115 RepID=A0A507CZ03_9FUNG|nr:hypothetical protein SeLEV6574_g04536 [Synchytrium endobioticum]